MRYVIYVIYNIIHISCVDKPVTYLYNTLHYYYKTLQDRKAVKKKLVLGILGRSCYHLSLPLSIKSSYHYHTIGRHLCSLHPLFNFM